MKKTYSCHVDPGFPAWCWLRRPTSEERRSAVNIRKQAATLQVEKDAYLEQCNRETMTELETLPSIRRICPKAPASSYKTRGEHDERLIATERTPREDASELGGFESLREIVKKVRNGNASILSASLFLLPEEKAPQKVRWERDHHRSGRQNGG